MERPSQFKHCAVCNHGKSEFCTLECTCCCSEQSEEYYRLDDSEYFGIETRKDVIK
jgi:hypothetical protein